MDLSAYPAQLAVDELVWTGSTTTMPPPPLRVYGGPSALLTLRNLAGGASTWRKCLTQPLLFRMRTEWNPKPQDLRRFTAGDTWLSSGLANRHANGAVGRLSSDKTGKGNSATTGGVAVAFALRACGSVAFFGLGGGSSGYVEDADDAARGALDDLAKVHDTDGERSWLDHLVASGRAKPVCYAPVSEAATRAAEAVRAKRHKLATAKGQVENASTAMGSLMRRYEALKRAKEAAERVELEAMHQLTLAERLHQAGFRARLDAIDAAGRWEREVEAKRQAEENNQKRRQANEHERMAKYLQRADGATSSAATQTISGNGTAAPGTNATPTVTAKPKESKAKPAKGRRRRRPKKKPQKVKPGETNTTKRE